MHKSGGGGGGAKAPPAPPSRRSLWILSPLKLINKALKCSWIKKYLDDENKGKWKLFLDKELERFGGKRLLTSNLSKNDLLSRVEVKDPFFKDVISVRAEVRFEPQLKSVEHFHTHTLWFNRPFYSCMPSDLAFEWKRGWR